MRTFGAEYGSVAKFEVACVVFCEIVNVRPSADTRRPPAQMLAEECTCTRSARASAHGRVRGGDPGGAAEHPDGELRSRPVLAPVHPTRQTVWWWAYVGVHDRGADEQVDIIHAHPG